MTTNTIKIINQRIKQDGGFEEIIELDLTDLKLTTITNDLKTILDQTKNVEVVLLSDNQFENLNNLPDWPLTALDISNNKLPDSALLKLTKFKDLGQLIASNNQIKTIPGLDPLFSLQKLEEIDLSDNPVCKVEGYRSQMFSRIHSLLVLDGRDINGAEVSEDEDEENVIFGKKKEEGKDENEQEEEDDNSDEQFDDDDDDDNDDDDGEGDLQQETPPSQNNN